MRRGRVGRIPDLSALESALIEWMEELHDATVGQYAGNCALGAVKLMSPRSFAELIDARALLQDWNAVGQANHWPPLPYPVLFLVAAELLACGQIGEALAILLAFSGLLRISEVAGLRVQDVVFPEDARFWGVSFVVVALEHTKTGDNLSAEVRVAWLWPLLRRLPSSGACPRQIMSDLGTRRLISAGHLCCNTRPLFKKKSCFQHNSRFRFFILRAKQSWSFRSFLSIACEEKKKEEKSI